MAGLVSRPEPLLLREPGAQLIQWVEQDWDPEAWCGAGHLVKTTRTSLNIKQRHRRPRSSGVAWLGGQAGPGCSPEPWQQRTVGCWPRKTAETKVWPSLLPSSICSEHHHTPSPPHSSVPIRSRPLRSDECSYLCTALMVPCPPTLLTHTHTHNPTCARTCRLFHTHIYTNASAGCSRPQLRYPSRAVPAASHLTLHHIYAQCVHRYTEWGTGTCTPNEMCSFLQTPYANVHTAMCKYVSEHKPATSLPLSVSLQ